MYLAEFICAEATPCLKGMAWPQEAFHSFLRIMLQSRAHLEWSCGVALVSTLNRLSAIGISALQRPSLLLLTAGISYRVGRMGCFASYIQIVLSLSLPYTRKGKTGSPGRRRDTMQPRPAASSSWAGTSTTAPTKWPP